jgi:hypothetical protein
MKCPACGKLEQTNKCTNCGYYIQHIDDELFNDSYCQEVEDKYEDVKDEELDKFNWGAFILTPFWGFTNGLPWLCLIYITVGLCGTLALLNYHQSIMPISFTVFILLLGCSLYVGFVGNRVSWTKKKWDSVKHFTSSQELWSNIGIAILTLCFFVVVIGIILILYLVYCSNGYIY